MRWNAALGISLLLVATCALRAGDLFELKPLERTPVTPVKLERVGEGHWFVDFGRDAFGWLQLEIDSPRDQQITVRLGEKLSGQAIDLKPGGSIRAAEVKLKVAVGKHSYRVETPADKRNTSGAAVRLPAEIGVVMPFRYAEILDAPVAMEESMVRQIAVHYPFDDSAASFKCSDDTLNQVWELCKYSMKATSFAGVFVDGDRERIPYEADAYINQLGWYCTAGSVALPRYTHEYLLAHPTWPTEWKQFSVLMAYQDWIYSGDAQSLLRNYDILVKDKMFFGNKRNDGLIDSSQLKDVVDWPAGERDGFVMSPANAVVNAFHYRTFCQLNNIEIALGKMDVPNRHEVMAHLYFKFNDIFFDPATGIYVDGDGIKHSSLHANLFALAFGLVPPERKRKVIDFIKSRGMACSVYPAQFLLDGLFENGEAEYAISLMTSNNERSWRHMLDFGSTITTEAWDSKFKPNMDWNHAWGAAPANIIPRYVLGVRPLEPGFAKALIAPQVGKLEHVEGVVPTIRGPVAARIDGKKLWIKIPESMQARVTWLGKTSEVVGEHVFESK